jgi:hypothetical protein
VFADNSNIGALGQSLPECLAFPENSTLRAGHGFICKYQARIKMLDKDEHSGVFFNNI